MLIDKFKGATELPLKVFIKRKKFLRYFCFAAVVSICVFIFYMSSKNGNASGEISGSLIGSFISFFDNKFSLLSLEAQLEIVAKYQTFVRKLAHFSVYAALGAFLFGFLKTFEKINLWQAVSFSSLFAVVYAATDEIHQLFIPGRTGSPLDVLLDFGGALFGILVLVLIISKFSKTLKEDCNE